MWRCSWSSVLLGRIDVQSDADVPGGSNQAKEE